MAIYNNQRLDKTFKALADPTRRQIIASLCKHHSCTAGELCDLFDSAQPTISKHIRVMEDAQLVVRQKDGRTHNFSLNPAALVEVNDWVSRHTVFWENSLQQLSMFLDKSNAAESKRTGKRTSNRTTQRAAEKRKK